MSRSGHQSPTMLPNPFSPSTTSTSFFQALKMQLASTRVRTFVAFWFLGLINNVLYVIILSAALDLVGPSLPKSLVLLFDVAPSFGLKLIAPYFIHRIGYSRRVILCVLLASAGMALIALSPDGVPPAKSLKDTVTNKITSVLPGGKKPPPPAAAAVAIKMIGIAMASLSSGAGELSFLALTGFYGPTALAAWGSGTGGAGLVGAGVYLLATTTLGLSVRASLLTFSCLPLFMLAAYFVVLPPQPSGLASPRLTTEGYAPVPSDDRDRESDDSATSSSAGAAEVPKSPTTPAPRSLAANLRRARSLVVP